MLSYCLKCKKKKNKKKKQKQTKSMNPVVSKTKNSRTMILSKFAICDSKKIKIY